MIDNLIESLMILRKYISSGQCPISWDVDILYVLVNPRDVRVEEIDELETMGFFADFEDKNFYSHRYGSA